MNKLSTTKSVGLALLRIVFLLPALALAQQDTGAIVGTVFDPGGAVVPGATVRVANTGTNISVTVTTDSSGVFSTPPLRIGTYRMEVEVSGFKKSVRDGIALRVQDRLNLDVRLEVGEVTQTVDVTATEVLLQTQTSSVGQIMETQTIVDLPLNGRNYIQLVALSAGAFVPQPMNTIWADQFVAINGNRAMLNSFLLDGVNNNTTDNSNPAIIPPPEAIAEFKVQTNAMAAEFGRSAGGAINVSIKSGTNQYHGNVFEFIRNDKLDANNFFNSGRAKPPLRQNQFGFTVGGPIAKDRTFFFGDFQGTRLRRGRTEVRTVPNPDERLGDFSRSGVTIYDPQTSRTNPNGTGVIRDPFAGNLIPDNRISAAAKKVIALYPLPNVAGARANNFIGNSKLSSDTDQFDVRVDHQFSQNDSVFGRMSVAEADHINPGSLETVASGTFRFPSNGSTPGRGAALGYTHTFSPTLINEVRGGFARLAWFGQVFDPSVRGSEQIGIPGIPKTDQTFGLPLFNITGLETLGDQGLLPVVRGKNTFNYLDNLTYIRGKHNFKAGVDTRFTQFNINQPGGPRGNFTFNGVFTRQPASPAGTGSGTADLLLGYADAASLSNSVTIGVRIRSYSGFFMDDWKVNQRLTLNLGLRYDLVTPPVEVVDRQLAFDLQRGQLVFAKPGSYRDRAFTDLDKNNFAPRFGFAFQATPSTVVRGGYGIFWAFEDNGTFNPAFNYPYRFTVSYPSDQVNTSSAVRLDTGFPANALTEFIPQFASYGSRDFNLRPAYVQQWNITLERQVHSILFGASYVGNKGTKLARSVQVNQPTPGPGGVNGRRPYLGFGAISNVASSGNSIYHGLLLKAEKRFTRGLSFLGSYTYSKAIEDSGSPALDNIPTAGPDTPQDPRDLRLERGLSPHDVRQRFVFSGVYELPFGRGKAFMSSASSVAEAFLGGWQLNGVSTLQTGRHFTFGNSIDQSNTGSSNVRANVVRDPRLPESQRTLQRFFDTSAIAVPAQFTYGNAGRNTGEGPGQVNLDLSLFKSFFFNRDTSGHFRPNELQFRVEAFNIANTPQFQNPNRILGTPQFGSITELVNTSRQIQFALKFFF